MEIFLQLFDSSDFPARWHCGQWTAAHGWLHILSDFAIWMAYMAIPTIIVYFVSRRKDIVFPKIAWLFAAFIFSCGTVHLIESMIFWWPIYRVSALFKLLTATVSISTVMALLPLIPKALDLPGQAALSQSLQQELEQRKKIEEQLRESEERFRATFEQAAVGLAHVGIDGGWLKVNQKLCDIVGYSRDELLQISFQDITHPDDLEADLTKAQQLLDGQRKTYTMEKRYIRKDGSEIWINLTGSLVRDDQQEPKYFIAVVEEIEARKQAEERLAQRSMELERANQELDSFVYIASHDLKEPLRTLVAYSTLLQEDIGSELPPRAEEDLHFISNAAERMQTLIDSLLQLSRVGRQAIQTKPISLNNCVQQALTSLRQKIDDTQAHIHVEKLPDVLGDEVLLAQLFQNLISNALKFVQEGTIPEIWITAEQVGEEWVIGVKDNGIGLSPEHSSKVFKPFQRLHGQSQYPGHGIGLSICQKVIERHQGRIWVESASSQGCRFLFTIQTRCL